MTSKSSISIEAHLYSALCETQHVCVCSLPTSH